MTCKALGRAMFVLDADFRVLIATGGYDLLVCPGATKRAVGQPIERMLGAQLFAKGEPLRAKLEAGGREEGRRAFLHCPRHGARLVSLTAAALPDESHAWSDTGARYIVVVRPTEAPAKSRGVEVPEAMVARSAAMLEVVHLIEVLQSGDASVLISGGSGTGKEVVARAIHHHSPHRDAPFVAVNCAALPAPLLESELFGHVRGAFTGATRDRIGRFEAAADGTIFLDEIGDMPCDLQPKLLRVVQGRAFERVGESQARSLKARIISATHVDFAAAVETGSFREDLYYRLRVVPIHLPPLRERPDDIEPLCAHLLERVSSPQGRALHISPDAMELLKKEPWPGNIRQLENALRYAVAVAPGQTIHVDDLPPELRAGAERAPVGPVAVDADEDVGDAVRIRAALEANHWHRNRSADALGISRATLWRKMRALGIE